MSATTALAGIWPGTVLAAEVTTEVAGLPPWTFVGGLALLLTLLTVTGGLAVCARNYRLVLHRQMGLAAIRRQLVSIVSTGLSEGSVDEEMRDVLGRIEQLFGLRDAFVIVTRERGAVETWPRTLPMRKQLIGDMTRRFGVDPSVRSRDLILVDAGDNARSIRCDQPVLLKQGDWLCLRRRRQLGIDAILCLQFTGRCDGRQLESGCLFEPHQLQSLSDLADLLPLAPANPPLNGARHESPGFEQPDRLKSIGAITSGISHDLNNILGVISINAEAAAPSDPANLQLARHLGEIRDATRRARDLVGSIVGYGAPDNGLMQPVDLAALLEDTRPLLQAGLPAGVSLRIEIPEVPVPILGNRIHLQQILLNLVHNAMQASHGQGQITLQLVREDQVDRAVARLSALDTGCGIPFNVLPRIFEPHFTTRQDGNGLGLATVKQLVERHNGQIQVESQVGRGTRFDIAIPLLQGESDAPALHRSVLILAADPVSASALEDQLAEHGHESVGFSDPAEALRVLAADPHRFDAAVMAGAQPPALLQAIHDISPAMPLIVHGSKMDIGPLMPFVTPVTTMDIHTIVNALHACSVLPPR